MSEGDVSAIHDEDVLRRMWQQTEDFGRKKEIRAHMYRLREERLRNLYTQDDAPTQRTEAKGREFTTSQGHTKSFADQSFQSIKSKEVRDAGSGSPPRDYNYTVQELKDSNAGWNVECENKTTDDGHTQVKSIQAHVTGRYDVDGGTGHFAALDQHKQAVTEYHDEDTSLKRNKSSSATSAHEEFAKKTDDGATFSSTTSSSSSSKFQQVSSSTICPKQPVKDANTADVTTSSEIYTKTNSEKSQNESREEQAYKTVSNTHKYETTLCNNEIQSQGELTSRKVEYPDENTKVIVETRTLSDGTIVTSTRREMKGPVEQSSRSEQHFQQTKSENRTAKSIQSQFNIEDSTKEVKYSVLDRKQVENFENNETHPDFIDRRYKNITQSDEIVDYCQNEFTHDHKESKVTRLESKQDLTSEKIIKDHEVRHADSMYEKSNKESRNEKELEESVQRKTSTNEHYQTTYQSDFSQNKISTDLSPTHQAWASTLRADTQPTSRSSVRGTSPYKSSTSSLRSSVSPDKYTRKPSSRGASPSKFGRSSPTRSYEPKGNQHPKYTSPEQKPTDRRTTTSPRDSPVKDTYRFIDEETKMSARYDSHHTDSTQTISDTKTNECYSQNPDKYSRPQDKSLSPTKKSPTKDPFPNTTRATKHDEYSSNKYSTKNESQHSTITSDNLSYSNIQTHSRESPQNDSTRHTSPPKVSFETDNYQKYSTKEERIEDLINKAKIHSRTPSPTKNAIICDNLPPRTNKSPERSSPRKSLQRNVRKPSPSKYESYEVKDDFTSTTEASQSSETFTRQSPNTHSPRPRTSPVKSPTKYHPTSTDFIKTEIKRDNTNRKKTTEHPRQLVTPSTSPTRKLKQSDAPSTGQSSPTTSVSEIVYFSSPRDTIPISTMVTDLDDEDTFSKSTMVYNKTVRNKDDITPERPQTLDVKRSPSPTKAPQKQSPTKENLPRKSSLKKPSADNLVVSPVEKPPTTFQISPTEGNKDFHEHKIVKKDRPETPKSVKKIKERPPFTRSETYEERCRKILGMTDKDSFIIEAEKTVSKIFDKLDVNEPTASTKSSSSVSPCQSPVREVSSELTSQRKPQDEKDESFNDFIIHEKETGERTTRYVLPNREPTLKQRTPSRDISPTKLDDIISESVTKTLTTTENINKNMTNQTKISRQSSRSSLSPQRKPSEIISKQSSRITSPTKSVAKNKVVSDEFISQERKQEIIDRVQNTLRKISPSRDKPANKRSPTREPSPSKDNTSLQDIICTNTETHETKSKEHTEKKNIAINNSTKEMYKVTQNYATSKQTRADEKLQSKSSPRNVSPTKRSTADSPKACPPSRTMSPNKSRSISPKKAVSTPDKTPHSPQINRKTYQNITVSTESNAQKNITKKSSLTEFPSQRKPTISRPTPSQETRKDTHISKQSSLIKTTTVKSQNKNLATNINRTTHSKTKTSSTMQVDSDSEEEHERPLIRRKSSDKGEIENCKISHTNKENVTPKPVVDLKITRTASDISINKINKATPSRMKSKPEINVSNLSKTIKTTARQTITTPKNLQQPNKLKAREPQSNLTSKPKSATTLNNAEDDDIIIDIQQAKSSRENSPDHITICPTPDSFQEDTGRPRLPDEVSYPDDEIYRRTHSTIHETDSNVDNIVEITEEEEVSKKISKVDRVTGSDECLLSVNEKVNKFLNKAETTTKDKTNQFKETEKADHSDYIIDQSDKCLLSVSEKVTKFATPNKDVAKTTTHDTPSPLSHNYDNPTYQDDYVKLSVNDKANLFVKTAEEIVAPIRLSEPAPKVERQDLSDVHESLKSDECLLSVSDKVNKFVQCAEVFLSDTEDIHTVTKSKDLKTKDSRDHKESYAKETVSSHAKVRDCVSPSLKNHEKAPTVKITTLHSSDSVKKAKALFENIASQQHDQNTHDTKCTKLTDIGVFNKSVPSDSMIVLHPSVGEGSPNLTDSEGEIDIAPYVQKAKNNMTNGTHALPQNHTKPIANGVHKTSNRSERWTRKSPERLQKSPDCTTKHDTRKQDVAITKNVLSRYPVGQKAEPVKESTNKAVKPPLSKTPEMEKTVEEIQVSTRRGSGKFGVELRRTSIEQVTTERRRSSTTEPHHQPCIEDIFDLDLLEQMLEKVVGYEQRRRIRAQMRIAKKVKETGSSVDTSTFKRHHTSSQQQSKINEGDSRNKSPDSKTFRSHYEKPINHTVQKETVHKSETSEIRNRIASPDKLTRKSDISIRHLSPEKKVRQPSPDKRMRQTSPDKKMRQVSPEKKIRQPSPEKRTSTQSPTKAPVSPKTKSNRFNEYASAYMRKVGLDEPMKNSDIKTKKTITETKEDHNSQFSTVTKVTIEEKSSTERKSSKDKVEVIQSKGRNRSPSPEVNYSRSSSPKKTQDHLYQRTPSPDFKKRDVAIRTKADQTNDQRTKISRVDSDKNIIIHKVATEEKPTWVTNNGLKKTVTTETRTFISKKAETEKPKYRSKSPSKVISKPLDLITSSYGVGPMDEDGKPLFGIKALRNGASNYQVKGTVIRSEYRSTNGGEPEGEVSVTAYSTNPDELARLLDTQGAPEGAVRDALHEQKQSRLHGLSAITTTKKFGGDTGTSINKVQTNAERQAIEKFSERRSDKKTVRQSSVKSLTEKFIKNAVETSKSEKTTYPKAGLILRTSGLRDTASSESSQEGLVRSGSENSIISTDEVIQTSHQTSQHGRTDSSSKMSSTTSHRVTHTSSRDSKSFLDSNTKVSGVQDILTRMKNADIVLEDGDSTEDAEARALLNKFLGATVLMAGMESYVTEKPGGKTTVRHESKTSRTISGSGGTGVTKSAKTKLSVDIEKIWDEKQLRELLEECTEYEQRRRIRSRLRQVMAEQEACAAVVSSATEAAETTDAGEREEEVSTVTSTVRRNSSEKTEKSEKSTTTKTTSKVVENASRPAAPKTASPFAKFRQLEKQNSTSGPNSPKTPQSPATPTTPSSPFFKFTDPALQASAGTIKERLLQWCRDKTRDYENIKLLNFSTSWSDGLAFCALIHHFLPDAFDYSALTPEKRRHNFTLAFKVADEKAGIYPLLDVDDMVAMRKPDWKCVFTYVQAIYRRFKDQE